MPTHFALDFSIARFAAEALGLYPQLEFRKVAGQSISTPQQQ